MTPEPAPPSDARGRRAAALAVVIGLLACLALLWVLARKETPRPVAPSKPSPSVARDEEPPNDDPFMPLALSPAPSGSARSGYALPETLVGVSTCEKWFRPIPDTCHKEKDAASRLVRASNAYPISATPCVGFVPTSEWRDDVRSALKAVLADPPDSLSLGERVLTQNAALRIALCAMDPAAEEAPSKASSLGKAAIAVVKHLALGADEVALVAPTSAEALPFLRGEPEIRETALKNFPIPHEAGPAFTHFPRLFKVQSYAVNVAHAVILDGGGTAHVTSVVDRVAVRALAPGVPRVCLAEAEPSYLRCGVPAGLAPIAAFGQPPLAGSTEVANGIPCGGCHTRPEHLGSELVSTSDLSHNLAERVAKTTTYVKNRLEYLNLDFAASAGPR